MMKRAILAAGFLTFGLWSSAGCAQNASDNKAMMKNEAVAHIEPTTKGKAKGTVTFTQMAGGKVKVVAHIEGLTANSKHGFHVHEGTECGDDGMKAGGHFNPDKHEHAGTDKPMRHAGDLGNLTANAQGVAHYEITVDNISVGGSKANNVLGHALIVHAKEDDLKSQPSGNAGDRIGCAIIKMAGAADAHAEHEKK